MDFQLGQFDFSHTGGTDHTASREQSTNERLNIMEQINCDRSSLIKHHGGAAMKLETKEYDLEIGWAYSSSETATEWGFGKHGCWYIKKVKDGKLEVVGAYESHEQAFTVLKEQKIWHPDSKIFIWCGDSRKWAEILSWL